MQQGHCGCRQAVPYSQRQLLHLRLCGESHWLAPLTCPWSKVLRRAQAAQKLHSPLLALVPWVVIGTLARRTKKGTLPWKRYHHIKEEASKA